MLSPKRVKFRKMFKGRTTGLATRGAKVSFGQYGLQALEPGWVSNRQIEAARVALTRHIKRGGKVWITVFPDQALTKKPAETRMGSGKGSPEWWVANVKPGRILFELSGPDTPLAKEAMRRAKPVLLEPVMAVEVEMPEDFMGKVMGDLSSRRGMVQGMEDIAGGGKLVRAEVPLSEMFGYSTTLRSLTQGRATYTMEFKRYAETTPDVSAAIMRGKGS